MTSLANNISMQKSLLKTFLHVKFLFVYRFSGQDNICMSVFHNVVIREKPPSKRCRVSSKLNMPRSRVGSVFLREIMKLKEMKHWCQYFVCFNASKCNSLRKHCLISKTLSSFV